MAETAENTASRDRSPAYPAIGLEVALGRLAEFETHFKRAPARPERVGEAWDIKTRSYADRIAAALRYFGLLEYQGAGKERSIIVSEEGRKYLRAQQEETKRSIIRAAALRPKQIAKFWEIWGSDQPADAARLDMLVIENGFSDGGAREFLKVYDSTISFANLSGTDKPTQRAVNDEGGPDQSSQQRSLFDPANTDEAHPVVRATAPPHAHANRHHYTLPAATNVMEDERELIRGSLSRTASFRLLVSGHVGDKEIERLIRKLELEKEILAEQEIGESDVNQ
jgi:hypothetical protein